MTKKSGSIEHLTFGCRLNLLESETMLHYAEQSSEDDVIIVNTCAVTKEAERQARQAVRKAHREKPNAKIIITGCASERDRKVWEGLPGVSKIISNHTKVDPKEWGVDKEVVKHTPSTHTRALLQIQQGCDNECTFCVIPQGRGKARTFPYKELSERIEVLLKDGHKEIVLTGVDLASWKENGKGLGHLCKMILKDWPAIERLRLSSLDPAILIGEDEDAELWDLLANEPRIAPSLHLSMQAGSAMILKRMKRRHTPEDLRNIVKRLREVRPNIGLGADLIAGFPTETDEYFEEGLELLKDLSLPFLHVFPYSERPGTPADKMPPVPKATRQERARVLREEGIKAKEKFHHSFIGKKCDVLFESSKNGVSAEFCRFKFAKTPQNAPKTGEIRTVLITDANTDYLLGTLA